MAVSIIHKNWQWSAGLAALSCFIALVVLIGYVFQVEILKQPLHGLAGMNPMTAISFLLVGVGLVAINLEWIPRYVFYISLILAFTISFVRLLGMIGVIEFQIDLIAFRDQLDTFIPTRKLSRMAANTTVSFILASISLVLSIGVSPPRRLIANICAVFIAGLAFISLVGYQFNVPEFENRLIQLPMAPHTALNFVFISVAILLHNYNYNIAGVITSKFAGGRMSRLLIPAAFVVPVLLGLIRLSTPFHSTLSEELGVSLIVVFTSVVFFLIIFFVSDKMNKEDERRINAEANLQDLYDNSPCGYLSVDETIHLSKINKTLLDWLGYSREEVIGKFKFEDLLTPDSRIAFLASFETDFERYKQDGYVRDLEFDFQRKDKTPLPVVVNSIARFDAEGNFLSSRTTVFDNTLRKESERKILALNKELESFSYSVSHDLRAPLRSVNGYADILEEDYAQHLDAEGKKVLNAIKRNAIKMGRLIDDLLEFSQASRVNLSRGYLNMNKIIEGVVQDVVRETQRNVEFRIHQIHDVKADINLVRQVWINLISNAVKYSRHNEKPLVEITSEANGSFITYMIRDNGVGFDDKYVHKLFEVFQRLHKADEFEGTGVGLALVRRIVERHGGKVWAKSVLTKGASFYFMLPKK